MCGVYLQACVCVCVCVCVFVSEYVCVLYVWCVSAGVCGCL